MRQPRHRCYRRLQIGDGINQRPAPEGDRGEARTKAGEFAALYEVEAFFEEDGVRECSFLSCGEVDVRGAGRVEGDAAARGRGGLERALRVLGLHRLHAVRRGDRVVREVRDLLRRPERRVAQRERVRDQARHGPRGRALRDGEELHVCGAPRVRGVVAGERESRGRGEAESEEGDDGREHVERVEREESTVGLALMKERVAQHSCGDRRERCREADGKPAASSGEAWTHACLSLYWPGKSFVALEEQETRMGVWNKRLADPGTMGARQAPGNDAGTLVFKTIGAHYKTHCPS